jgi:hypothetical protein
MAPRAVLGLVLAFTLVALAPGRVVACTCGGTSEDSALIHADVAFVGVVANTEDPNPLAPFTYSTADPILYTFAIEEVRKGEDIGAFLTVRSARDGASCGLTMAVGERWSIYAHRGDIFGSGSDLWVFLCDANERLATGVAVPPAPGGLGSGLAPPILLLGAGAGAAVLVLRMRRRRALPTPPQAEA